MACYVCTETEDPMLPMITRHGETRPVRTGCACRGDGGTAHVGCMAMAASMATDSSWWACRTCTRMFTGKMRELLAKEYLAVATDGPRRTAARMNMATVMRQNGMVAEAESIHRELLAREVAEHGEDTWVAIGLLKELTADTSSSGDTRGAVELGDRLLVVCERVFGPLHVETVRARSDLAMVSYKLISQPERMDAEKALRAAIDDAIAGNADEALVMRVKCNLCTALRDGERHAEAREAESDVLRTITRVFGPDHPSSLRSRCSIATDLMHEGKLADAELSIRELVRDYERVFDGAHRSTVLASATLVAVLMRRRKAEEAESVARERAQVAIDSLGATHADAICARCCHAVAVCFAGRPREAEAELRSMLECASPGNTACVLRTIESVDRMRPQTARLKRAHTAL
jgi:hypothetical protein